MEQLFVQNVMINQRIKQIDFTSLNEIEKSPQEAKDFAAQAISFYRNGFEKFFKRKLLDSLIALGTQTQSQEDMWLMRGTANGLFLILDFFENQEGILQNKEE